MSVNERIREHRDDLPSEEELRDRQSEGWRVVAVEWERGSGSTRKASALATTYAGSREISSTSYRGSSKWVPTYCAPRPGRTSARTVSFGLSRQGCRPRSPEEEKKFCSLRDYESWCVVGTSSDCEPARGEEKRGGE